MYLTLQVPALVKGPRRLCNTDTCSIFSVFLNAILVNFFSVRRRKTNYLQKVERLSESILVKLQY